MELEDIIQVDTLNGLGHQSSIQQQQNSAFPEYFDTSIMSIDSAKKPSLNELPALINSKSTHPSTYSPAIASGLRTE